MSKKGQSQSESSEVVANATNDVTVARASEREYVPTEAPFLPPAREQAKIGKEWTGHVGDFNPGRVIEYDSAPTDAAGNPTDFLVFFSLMPEAHKQYIVFGSQLRAAALSAGVDVFTVEPDGRVLIHGGFKVQLTKNKFAFLVDESSGEEDAATEEPAEAEQKADAKVEEPAEATA